MRDTSVSRGFVNMIVDEESFLLFAGKHYDMRRVVSIEEFGEDIKRFQYLKRLFKRYKENRDLKVQLILNHLIVLYNCFGLNATAMLFYKLPEYSTYLKPFLDFLGFMPDTVIINGNNVKSNHIISDQVIQKELDKF